MGEWLMTVQESYWLWTKKQERGLLKWPTRIIFYIISFVVFQLLNLTAQVRWPFSALVRFINSLRQIQPGTPIPVNHQTLQRLVEENQVVLVDFWTEWCGPCILMEGSIKKFAQEFKGKIVVAKVDATINPKLTKQYNVMGYPTIMLFFEGKEIGRVTGAQNYRSLVEFIGNHLFEE